MNHFTMRYLIIFILLFHNCFAGNKSILFVLDIYSFYSLFLSWPQPRKSIGDIIHMEKRICYYCWALCAYQSKHYSECVSIHHWEWVFHSKWRYWNFGSSLCRLWWANTGNLEWGDTGNDLQHQWKSKIHYVF